MAIVGGGSLVGALAENLGKKGIQVDQVTFLDTHPITGDWGNGFGKITVPENVAFADSYWRTGGIWEPNGEPIIGAYDVHLNNDALDNAYYGTGLTVTPKVDPGSGSEHADTHIWYHGTIDTVGSISDGEVDSFIPPGQWYSQNDGDYPSRGPRTATGYFYSRIARGDRPSSGLARAGATREPVSLTVTGDQVWDNIEFVNLVQDRSIASEQPLPIHFIFEDDNSDATVSYGYDKDANPFNGHLATNFKELKSTLLDNRNGLGVREALSTIGLPTGEPLHVFASITNGIHTRYYYASGTVTVNSSPLPNAPVINVISPARFEGLPLPQTKQITIDGTGFTPKSRLNFFDGHVRYNDRVPTYVSPTKLTYDIKVGTSPADWTVTVLDSGAQSNDSSFSVTGVAPAPTNDAPVISDVSAVPSANGVVLQWKTNKPATTQVEYDTNSTRPWHTLYKVDAALVTQHAITLSGLAGSTSYYYRIWSVDSAGNATYFPISGSSSFTTDATPARPADAPPSLDVTAPAGGSTPFSGVVLQGTVTDDSGLTPTVFWNDGRGHNGRAIGTGGAWSTPPLGLQPGQNVLTISAFDSYGNMSSRTKTVVYAAPIADRVWTGAISTDWNTPGNWSPTGVPTGTNNVAINSGNVVFSGASVPSIALNGGTLEWTGGTITTGMLDVAAGATLRISGPNQHFLGDSVILNNNGVISHEGTGYVYLNGVGTINNLAGGLWDLRADGGVSYQSAGAAMAIHNAGTIRKSGGAGAAQFGDPNQITFNNAGAVEVTSGTLYLYGKAGSTLAGASFAFANNAQAVLGGTWNLSGTQAGNGQGALQFQGTIGVAAGDAATLSFGGGGSRVLWNGGSVGGPGALYNAGRFEWSRGSLVGKLTNTGPSFTLTGDQQNGNQMYIAVGGTLANSGTVTHQGPGYIYLNGGGTINNLAGGLWDLKADSGVSYINADPAMAIHNAGTIRKSGGAGASQFGDPGQITFSNAGAVEVTSGTLYLYGKAGSTLAGASFAFANNAQAVLGGTWNLSGTQAGTGQGALQLQGTIGVAAGDAATLSFGGGGSRVLWNGGSVGGPGALYNAGPFEWSRGSLVGNLTNTGPSFLLTGDHQNGNQMYIMAGGTLANSGTITHHGPGYVVLNGGGTINNLAGGLWDLKTDTGVTYTNVGPAMAIHNAGTIRKSGGITSSGFGSPEITFSNAGAVEVTSGTLLLYGKPGSTMSGAAFAFANTARAVLIGTFDLTGAIAGSGQGVLEVSANLGVPAAGSATLNFGGASKIQWTGGSITGPGSLENAGCFEWLGGGLSGPGSLLNTGTFTWVAGTLSGSINNTGAFTWLGGFVSGSLTNTSANFVVQDTSKGKVIDATGVLVNSGGITVSDSSWIGGGGSLFNLPSGTIDLQSDGNLALVVNSSGTIRKTGGGATSSVGGPFRNSGTVEVLSGTLSLSGHIQLGGSTIINGGNLSGALSFQGGELTGVGSISGSLINGAVIRPGLPGLPVGYIIINGPFTQQKAGRLELDIAGTIPSIQHDRLEVFGNATLDGTLRARFTGPFNPSASSVFNALFHNSRSGQFSTMDLDVKNGLRLTPIYNATGVSLGMTAQPRLLVTAAQFVGGVTAHRLTVQFNADVSASFDRTDFVIEDLTTGATIPASATALSFNAANNTATLTFPGFPGGVLPAANYRVTLPARSVKDAANNEMDSDLVKTFSAPGDVVAPVVAAANFDYGRADQSLVLQFSENVSASLSLSDVVVQNLTSGAVFNPTTFAYDLSTNTVTFGYSGHLANGDYRATIAEGGVSDANGNPLPQYVYAFYHLNGDANRNRAVDFGDLVLLAQNYNTAGKTWATGDFNGDASVDFNDLVILAQNYNTSLGGVPAGAASKPGETFAAAFARAQARVAPAPPRPAPAPKPVARPVRPAARPLTRYAGTAEPANPPPVIHSAGLFADKRIKPDQPLDALLA